MNDNLGKALSHNYTTTLSNTNLLLSFLPFTWTDVGPGKINEWQCLQTSFS